VWHFIDLDLCLNNLWCTFIGYNITDSPVMTIVFSSLSVEQTVRYLTWRMYVEWRTATRSAAVTGIQRRLSQRNQCAVSGAQWTARTTSNSSCSRSDLLSAISTDRRPAHRRLTLHIGSRTLSELLWACLHQSTVLMKHHITVYYADVWNNCMSCPVDHRDDTSCLLLSGCVRVGISTALSELHGCQTFRTLWTFS